MSEKEFEGAGRTNEEEARTAARKIVDGHAYRKHAAEFPGESREEFEQKIWEAIVSPSELKLLPSGRAAYWSESEQMIVIVDSHADDGGTAFRPKLGREYSYRLR